MYQKERKKIKLHYILFVLIFGICCLTACRSSEDVAEEDTRETVAEAKFYRKIASEMDEKTGWHYSFMMEALKEDPSQRVYTYIVMNLRYRYKGDYWDVTYSQHFNEDNSISYLRSRVKSGIMIFGRGGEAEIRDRYILNSILDPETAPESLLRLNPADYSFEVLDKDIFFRLMQTALEGENAPESIYLSDWQKPMHAMLVEQQIEDGYRFQIGFSMNNTVVDEIYIDVLYQTGEEYDAYDQLSDKVDNGTASAEQKEAFALIQTIRREIKEKRSFVAYAEEYKEKVIGGLDFSRLFDFLDAIDNDNISNYTSTDNVPWIVYELSEAEAIEDMKRRGLEPQKE